MTPDELLQRYPREALRWMRGRLGLTQLAFALEFDLSEGIVGHWEAQRWPIGAMNRVRLVPLLAPHLETAEGRAWLAKLGEDA